MVQSIRLVIHARELPDVMYFHIYSVFAMVGAARYELGQRKGTVHVTGRLSESLRRRVDLCGGRLQFQRQFLLAALQRIRLGQCTPPEQYRSVSHRQKLCHNRRRLLGPFHGAIAVPSVTHCRCCCCCCCRGHRTPPAL